MRAPDPAIPRIYQHTKRLDHIHAAGRLFASSCPLEIVPSLLDGGFYPCTPVLSCDSMTGMREADDRSFPVVPTCNQTLCRGAEPIKKRCEHGIRLQR